MLDMSQYATAADLPPEQPAIKPNGNGHGHRQARPERPSPLICGMDALGAKVFPPIQYVVPGYIVEGCTLFAGRPKLGKSWLMLDVALAVARGEYCLGDIKCDKGNTLYLALEDNERRLQSRVRKITSDGNQDAWPATLEYCTEFPKVDAGGLRSIEQWIQSRPNPRLIVVDVLNQFRSARGDKETLYESDYHCIKGLQELAGKYRVGIVVIHHTRKGGGDIDPFEKVSGTLGLSGAADTTLVLDRDGNGATLYGRGRDIEEIESAVQFDRDMCRWRVLGEAKEIRRTDERGSILALLEDAGEPMSPGEIADALGMPRNNVKQLLFKMAKADDVARLDRGRYVHPKRTDLVTGEE